MKQLIVLLAVVLILLTFPLQYAVEQKNHHNLSQFQKYVNEAKEQAKIKGYFTPEIISKLRNNILDEFDGINDGDIVIDVTITPKYRTNIFDDREIINYKIGVPINKIVAVPDFWGISDAENQYLHVIDNYTTSELPMP